MMDQRPMMPQNMNPFFSSEIPMNGGIPQQNPLLSNDPSATSPQGNKVDDDTVSVESA